MAKRFRTTMVHQAGTDPAQVVQGRVVNINLVNWTVDVSCTFDRKRFFDIQVGTPYLHFNNGEGFSAFPEVGAVCHVCIPGDSSPPFVLSFVMPHELVDGSADDAPLGTRSHGNPANNATDASFAGGRTRAKPGDIFMRTRDGNFVILHRGGVLQIGSTELAQRIYVPLGNLVMDISGTYEHFNTGGAITWGIQEGPTQTNFPSQHLSTFRIFANDKFADIKIAKGKVFNPMPDKDGGALQNQAGVGQGKDNPIIYELSVSPKGFIAETGDISSSSTPKNSVLRFVFDRTGNTLLRCEGNLALHVSKKVILDVSDDVLLTGQKSLSFTLQSGAEIDGGAYAHLKGKVVLLGPGSQPVARLGDLVGSFIQAMPAIFVPAQTQPLISGVPVTGILTIGAPGLPLSIPGAIVTGQYTVKA